MTHHEILQYRMARFAVMPPNATQIRGEFEVCQPIDTPFEGLIDPSWYEKLFPIEELVCFTEHYQFPEWNIPKQSEGQYTFTPTHLGIVCDLYLPMVADVDRFTFPQEGRRYSDCFYAFIEACEETRQAGFTAFDSLLHDDLSLSFSALAQNVLVEAIRTKMKIRRAREAFHGFMTPDR